MSEETLPEQPKDIGPEKTLDWYLKKRGDKKREYIFSFRKAKSCPHNHLHAMVVGGQKYRCEDCNWCFDIVTTHMQPLHNVVVGSLLQVMHFSKEFGHANLQEVLRTPKGQHELDYHLPALPEGMNFWDALEALESVDVNQPDRGAGELRKLFEQYWVPEAERQRRHKELESANPYLKQLLEKFGLDAINHPEEYANAVGDRDTEDKLLEEAKSGARPIGVGRSQAAAQAHPGGDMPMLQDGTVQSPQSGRKRRTILSRLHL